MYTNAQQNNYKNIKILQQENIQQSKQMKIQGPYKTIRRVKIAKH